MKQVMAVLVLVTFAGCVDVVVRPGPDVDTDTDDVGDPTAPGALAVDASPIEGEVEDDLPEPPPAEPPGWARCEAEVMPLSLDDGTCVARVSVRFDCSRRAQTFTWARIGVLAGEEELGSKDLAYTCRSTVVHVFEIPCDDKLEIIGGATFDHPQSAEDVSCESPSFHSAP